VVASAGKIAMNLVSLSDASLDRLGEQVILDFEGERITNATNIENARRLHRALAHLGVTRGENVVLCMANHPRVYDIFGGIFRTGGTAVPVMPTATEDDIRYILEDTRARGVITDDANLPKVREAARTVDSVQWIVVRGGCDVRAIPREIALDSLLSEDPATTTVDIRADSDVALMIYTSGTTGRPKGVMLTHANLVAAAQAGNDAAELHLWEGPRIGVSAMPMAHIFGVGVMTSGYTAPKGLEGYLVQLRWFDATRVIELIEQHRATVLPAVPTMLTMILNHPEIDRYDLSSLRQVICGAAPLAPELAIAFQRRFGCRVTEAYGMTENAGIATYNRFSEAFRPGSAGRACRDVELRIVDDDDREVATGHRGEILTRGATVMKGYYGKPEATAETLRGGWLHTGDIGLLDGDGFLYVVDRKKDMIIKGGENIYPAELEALLYAHPAVVEAAIVGVPDDTYGEIVAAFVVPKEGARLSPEAIVQYVAERTGRFKAPDIVVLRASLPKLGVGKVLRRQLRDEALRHASAPTRRGKG
jgi:long-chain acyl-CoA synthetase